MSRDHTNNGHAIDLDDNDDDVPDPRQRSRRANGRMPREVDGRSANARRLRDITAELLADLEEPDAAERALVARTAALMLSAERHEARLAQGDDNVDPDALIRLRKAVSSGLSELGLFVPPSQPRTRDRTKTTRRTTSDDGDSLDVMLAKKGYVRAGVERDDLPPKVRKLYDAAAARAPDVEDKGWGLPAPGQSIEDWERHNREMDRSIAFDDDADAPDPAPLAARTGNGKAIYRRPLPPQEPRRDDSDDKPRQPSLIKRRRM